MMVDLTKTLNNNTADMIRLAQIFVQQPRNTVCLISSIMLVYLVYFVYRFGAYL